MGLSQRLLVNPERAKDSKVKTSEAEDYPDASLARNCTNISPCQQDSTIIRDSEITQNIVNSCGRTEIDGNIDVGGETEKELAANRVTTVQKGSVLAVTIHQVNADGAGPYECDLDQTSNAATNFVKLDVSNNVPGQNGLSQAEAQDFTINVQMPADFNCIGASTGDICTVRCRNNAVAGPFGGCFAVQQTDGTGRTNTSAAGKSLLSSAPVASRHEPNDSLPPPAVDTAQTLAGINAQVAQNKKDLPAAIAANQAAGAVDGNAGASAISALLPAATGNANTGNTGNANTGNNANNGNAATGNRGNGNAATGNTGNAATGNTGNANTGNTSNGRGNGRGGRNRNNNNRRSKFLTHFMA
ncbi:hypothetical protein N0V90_008851 [Kalmusia sp. IMI 367209]|nr:hypothetical protein N0V90_008851 [Kalmusia sp. IMI 367209]